MCSGTELAQQSGTKLTNVVHGDVVPWLGKPITFLRLELWCKRCPSCEKIGSVQLTSDLNKKNDDHIISYDHIILGKMPTLTPICNDVTSPLAAYAVIARERLRKIRRPRMLADQVHLQV